jgi:glycyl-tRNA synthetase
MAHYAMDCWDAEVKTDRFGWVEVVGIADRTNYDLTAHAKQSKVELSVYVEYPEPIFETKFVIKPDMGKLGPLFKGKAKAVGDALKELGAEEIQSAGEEISVTVDGEILSVPKNLIAFGEEKVKISGKTVVPHVIEPSYGIDRITYCVMEHAFVEEDLTVAAAADDSENDGNGGNDGNRGRDGSDGNNESDGRDGNSGSDGRDGSDGNSGSDGRDGSNGNSGSDGRDGNDEKEDSRVIMKFKNAVAPYQVAVHPLMGKAELSNAAKKLFNEIVSAGIMVDYDESGTIGKRYRRNDEIGIPYSVTIDYDPIEKETNPITIRDRDTMKQILVPAANLVFVLENLISGKKTFEESGEILSR